MTTTTPLLDLVAECEQHLRRGHATLAVLTKHRERYRQAVPHHAELENDLSAFGRAVDRLEAKFGLADDERLLDSQEAAEMLGMVKPSGRPTHYFRHHVAPLLRVSDARPFRYPLSKVAAFKKGEM
jgi:hypothetical protein